MFREADIGGCFAGRAGFPAGTEEAGDVSGHP